MGNLQAVTWTLAALTVATVVLTALTAARDGAGPWTFVPAGVLVAVLAAWPFMLGWRPWTPAAKRLHNCQGCGAEWRPVDEGGVRTCPVCT